MYFLYMHFIIDMYMYIGQNKIKIDWVYVSRGYN